MENTDLARRHLLTGAAVMTATAMIPFKLAMAAMPDLGDTVTFKRTAAPDWLLAMWKEIDDKTWGKGLDCFAEDAICNLGVADWHGREAIRNNLREFVDKQMTTHHEVVEYWDGGALKVFRGAVTMKFNDPSKGIVKPTMTHFFYMDKNDPAKVTRWYGAVGPIAF
jgi:hypothetical protein